MKYRIKFNPELCDGCSACEVACRELRKLDRNINYIRIIREDAAPEQSAAAYKCVICRQCAKPQCNRPCPNSAMERNDDGVVLVSKGKCVSCRSCEISCPFGVPQFGRDGIMQKCDLCYKLMPEEERFACVKACLKKALSVEAYD